MNSLGKVFRILNSRIKKFLRLSTDITCSDSGSKSEKPVYLIKIPAPRSVDEVWTLPTTEETFTIRVDGEIWKEVSSFSGSKPEDRIYTVNIQEDGRTNITFGDGEHGRTPSEGSDVFAVYKIGGGSSGEAVARFTAGELSRIRSNEGKLVLFSGIENRNRARVAQSIASELNLPLFQIDLSTVISKYIGETEKNLTKIFTDAEAKNAILFFDEADALFGKRSDVKDAHDRYADIEINDLLKLVDDYPELIILAANDKNNLDPVFLPLVRFEVEFPKSEIVQRDGIWTVKGRVTNSNNVGQSELVVSLYDKDLVFDDKLGTTTTDQDGYFTIQYHEADFQELLEARPDLFIEVLDARGRKLYSSKEAVRFEAGKVETFDIIVDEDEEEE